MSNIIGYQKLPNYIIESEILPQLPAKSVVRFMCVCKQWYSFLSTQHFRRKNHHNITTNRDPPTHQKLLILKAPSGIFHTLDCGTTLTYASVTTSTRCTPFGSDPDGMHILATFDGLVCVALSNHYTNQLLFWNPLTGAYRKLSKSRVHSFNRIYMDAFGFYSDCSNDYKLLNLVRKDWSIHMGQPKAYVYSTRLDSWREILSFNYGQYLSWATYQWSPATFFGQSLYFTVVSEIHSCIIGFDVVSEKFREIQFPRDVSVGRGFNGTLVVMNGCVHLCVARRNIMEKFYMPSKDIDLWRMDGDGWMKVEGNMCIPFTLTPNCKVRDQHWIVTWVFNKALEKQNLKTHKKPQLLVEMPFMTY
ncbi:hypothetical protein QVD17_26230 [Tagetes erecta]|uniref:F-box domain-containing protein n=1 Tax=Tagetes erecta TaxID=13708 RepID=A0AAD8NQL5_TARER|nr:hypothetical protein QVD17_26230 [Tagetes erecta]